MTSSRALAAFAAIAALAVVAGCGGGQSGASSATQGLLSCLREHGAQPRVEPLGHAPRNPVVAAGAITSVRAFAFGSPWFRDKRHQGEFLRSGINVLYYVFKSPAAARAALGSVIDFHPRSDARSTAAGPVVVLLSGYLGSAPKTVAQARACAAHA